MYPIIFLWAHPRSMSTAIERVMRERGDFNCLHEPFLHYYYLERGGGKALPHFDSEQDHPVSYDETRNMILQHARKAPVFAKDMSYYVVPEILQDQEFCRRVRHCFLIRHPLRSILSYHRLDPDVALDEIGLEAQWMHYQGLQELGIEDSVVLEAEAVQADSVQAMTLFWQALGLDFKAEALNWDPQTTPRDWQYVKGWHQDASNSQGIRPQHENEANRAREEFRQYCRSAPQLQEYLDHHLPYYEHLRAMSVTGVPGDH